MRYLFALLLLLCFSVNLMADEQRILTWYQTTESTPDLPFKEALFTDSVSLPVYAETYRPTQQAGAYTVAVSFPQLEPLTAQEVERFKSLLLNLPDTLTVTSVLTWERKKPVLELTVLPFIRKGRAFYKLTSFQWFVVPTTTLTTTLRAAITPAVNSVLSTGKWIKLSVTASGMYRLSYDDVVGMGINPDKVQVYGYGGKLMGENFNTATYADDLPQVAVWKTTGDDGVFNRGDDLLFYAQGPISWSNGTGFLTRTVNPYSNKGYYFIGEREAGTLLAGTTPSALSYNRTVTSYTHLVLHEEDLVNMGESVSGRGTGRELYGEDVYSTPSRTFEFTVPDIDTTQNSSLTLEAAVHNTAMSYGYISVDGTEKSTVYFSGIQTGSTIETYGSSAKSTVSFRPTTNTIKVGLDVVNNGSSSTPRAFLNYIALNVRRLLKASEATFTFRDPASVATSAISQFVVSQATSSTRVFDVTNPQAMTLMEGTLVGTDFQFVASTATLREYACVSIGGNIPKPTIEGTISNQNLHSYQPDMVILSPPVLLEQAQRLAKVHAEKDNLSVLVVTPEQVFNEFSSGTPDATAYRRLMKCYYDKATTEAAMPDYLLLFGGGVYDNRLNTSTFASTTKKNTLLTYQSSESLYEGSSFITDDYFGFLDDTEGANLAADKMDIGIGRFPVHTVAQAKTAVDKTLRYMENKRKGTWKNRLLFLADDGDSNLHTRQAEELATYIEGHHSQYMVNRIYVDAYKKVVSTSGISIPDGNTRFEELLDKGLLFLNYTGHGSMTEWAVEKILTQAWAKTMTNACLPLWITATCDFTRFDAPDESGGESAFLNPNGGAIALLTTTRVVYAEDNFTLNQRFIEQILVPLDGKRATLGKIMQYTKSTATQSYNDRNKLNFTLIGDPALKLLYPEYEAVLTQVNGKVVTAVVDTFSALQQVTFEGEIHQEDGSLATTFNGLVYPTLLDAATAVKTLGSDGADIFTFYDKSKVLLSAKDSVVNGRFKFTVVIPKDIQYSFKSSRINLYASDNDGLYEANGIYDRFVLGGTSTQTVTDTVGPEIRLFLNDTTYVEGQAVNQTPTLIAKLFDQTGLNSSENGVGHDFQVVIDNNPNLLYNLNGHFAADVGSYQSGTVQFVFPELSAGTHSLSFRAWDVLNQSNTQTLSFVVKPGLAPSLYRLVAVRQSDSYQFQFSHNRPEIPLSVRCEVLDILGRRWWQEAFTMQTGETLSDVMTWNLSGNTGKKVSGGIYVCRVWVTDSNGGVSTLSEKIQVLPQ